MAMNRLPSLLFVAFSAAILAPLHTSADLGAAIWRSKHRKSPVPPPTSLSPGGSLVVPLKRVGARGPFNSSTKSREGHFYVGSISVGQPAQVFSVVFDTSSGHVLLPHRACRDRACREHHQYSSWESQTASDINANGQLVMDGGRRFAKGSVTRDAIKAEITHADFGDGWAEGMVVRDRVCLGASGGEHVCTDVGIMAAIKLDEVPFRAMPQDGVVGLGLEGLTNAAFCSFFERLVSSSPGMLPHFGILLREVDGEIHFGSHDRAKVCGPMHWFPVVQPEQGFWQVVVQAVRVGNTTVGDCRDGCRAIIDTSASRLGVLRRALPQLHNALLSTQRTDRASCQGPDLQFDLGGSTVKLSPQEYADHSTCAPRLGAVDLDEPSPVVYAFGEVVLRRYYVSFDWGSKRIGFAQIACEEESSSAKTSPSRSISRSRGAIADTMFV